MTYQGRTRILIAAALVSTSVLAEEQTWRATPASANWNKSDLNWDSGAAWTDKNKAVFGDSSTKSIKVTEKVMASGIKVTSGDYTFGGPTSDNDKGLVLSSASATSGEQVYVPVETEAGASATFDTFIKMFANDAFYKKGAGTVTLSSGGNGLQFISHGGTLRLTGGTFSTVKLYKDSPTETASLHLDKATLKTWNADKLIGHPYRFNSATIGEHGFTIESAYDAELHQTFSKADGLAADGGIKKTGAKQLLIAPQGGEKSTFTGGIAVVAGELAVANADGLGSGAVTVKTDAGVVLQDAALGQSHAYDLENGGVFGAIGKNYVIDRPGEMPSFATSNFRKVLGLGRVGGKETALTLAPTTDERLGGVNLAGKLDLTLGGSIKLNEFVDERFFRADALANGSLLQVAAAGCAIDVPTGVKTDFGIPLAARQANALVASTTADSFESDNDGWSLAKNGSTDGDPARSNNGGSFIKSSDYYTTDGSSFIYLRRKNSMEKSITLPSDGQWRVAFSAGCRPGYNSHRLTITVAFGDKSYTVAARDALHGFREFATPTYEMTAGAKTVRITLGDGDQWTGMGIDKVRLEKFGDAPAPFSKTGAGELALNGFSSSGEVTVSAGTLALEDADLKDAQVAVADGATLALGRVRLDGTRVSVPAGATLALRAAGVNLVKNGSFEEPGGSSATDWKFVCTGWTFSQLEGRTNGQESGGQNNGSVVSPDYRTPYGCATAFIRSSMQMKQSVSVPEDGEYVLSFVHSQRNYGQDPSYKNPISVTIDDAEVVNIQERTANIDFTRVTATPISLKAGKHELSFKNTGAVGNPDGAMVFIDDVSLSKKTIDVTFANGACIDLVTGSVVRLDNAEKLEFDKGAFTVNGQPFNGTRNMLRSKGVVIEGEGKIQVGTKLGLTVIFR